MDYRQAAMAAATRHGVPSDLFMRVIQQESAWKPDAVSHAGAIGLGQLMPGTAKDLGVDPYDPLQNLDGSARYLSQQLKTFGAPELALAAYNAGPGNVRKYGGIPPFKETQDYIAKITGDSPQSVADDTMSLLGFPPQSGDSTRMTTPNGLLGPIPQEPQREPGILERSTGGFLNPDRVDRMIVAMQGMTLNPNEALMNQSARNIQNRADARKAQGQASRTAEWLKDKNPQLAAAVAGGMIDPRAAVQMALAPAKDDRTAMMKNFMFAQERGYQGTFEDFMKSGGAGGVVVNVGSNGQKFGDPPKDMTWARDANGNVLIEQVDVGGGRMAARPVAVPIQGTGADQTSSDLESARIAAIDNAQRMLDTIDGAMNDPGLATATGGSRFLSFIPGSAGRRANTRIAQLQGQTFLQAYETLKGGGQITEVEGKKASEAMNRLGDPWIGDEDYKAALQELRGVVENALARAKLRGGARANDMTDDELLELYGQ